MKIHISKNKVKFGKIKLKLVNLNTIFLSVVHDVVKF